MFLFNAAAGLYIMGGGWRHTHTQSGVLLPSQLRATGPEPLPGTTAGGPRWVEVVGSTERGVSRWWCVGG